jgi:peptidyl-dipeptidase A
MDDFLTVHHELGHVQYYLQYEHLPTVYQDGANPGFHEAIGEVLTLSVSTAKHLKKVGLLKKDFEYTEKARLNQFVRMGLQKLIILPSAYTFDKFRWEAFRGNIKPENANCKYWELKEKYNGFEPPVFRSNDDFDVPAKYHMSADIEYIRYFVAHIIQFQFYEAMCKKAGELVPGDPKKTLSDCDVYGSAEAGEIFK